MHEVFRLRPVSICFQYSKKFHKKTFSFSPPKNTSIIGTTENALLHYTKKQKWSYRMKRVINNKTKKKIIFLQVLHNWKARNECIIYCRSFQITKTTLIGCLAKTSQDQYLKLSPKHHIFSNKVIFEKKQ